MNRLSLFIAAGLLSCSSGFAAECLTAQDLAATHLGGLYFGGSHVLPSGVQLQIFTRPSIMAGGGIAPNPGPKFETSPSECAATSATSLFTHSSAMLLQIVGAATKVTVTICDGAEQNNVSARFASIDFVGDAAALNGQTLTGPDGAAVSIAVTPPTGDPRDISFSGTAVKELVVGGAEVQIAKICVE